MNAFGRPSFVLLSSMLVFGLAACGGGGGDETPAPTPTPTPLPSPPGVPPLAVGKIKLQSQQVGTKSQWSSGDTSTGGQGNPVDGIPCAVVNETFHTHQHLSIFLNGDQLIVPDHVGIPSPGGKECLYIVHTHDMSGMIHIESATPVSYTLGTFFHIWGQPLDRTNIAGITGLPVTVYVVNDGDTAATEYTGDLAAIDLTTHRQITIVVGSAITTIPNYDFDGA